MGDARPLKLAEAMPARAAEWERIVERHGLERRTLHDLVGASWQFADLTFGYGKARMPDRLMSPIKIRKAGFAPCMDTEDSVLYWLTEMQKARLLPRY